MLKILAGAIVAVSLGALLIRFRKEFAALCVRDQNHVWGFRFGERTIRVNEVVLLIVGLLSIGMGLAFLLYFFRLCGL